MEIEWERESDVYNDTWTTTVGGVEITLHYHTIHDRWFLTIEDGTEDGWEQDYKEKPTTQDVIDLLNTVIQNKYQDYLDIKNQFESTITQLQGE